MDLFSQEKQHFNLPNAELVYIPNFFSVSEADSYFKAIETDTNWQHDDITVFGKTYKQPRLTALFGDSNQPYGYSNIVMHPEPFTKPIQHIKAKIEDAIKHSFNTVLVNLYRNGNDSNGWHADNEKELGEHPVIASVSFGELRAFHFKHRTIKEQRHKLILEHGSLLIMEGEMQKHWLHQITKTKKDINPRINLTFRKLITL
ncbi:alpha-ketoglutarate-dependent dioxygenase AlkB family protein [Winogradskyella sp. UBA3174]|uniref:alpha-ketoglutarate-dependent dioxygenase AlkB family protein n=1 Tax=Winogradskyella sp. UBA3174 TaxID=1947785 RepID=UPI0025F4551C|nr:alpha-ketoglutarate-dependent dioxygenase AlkB [Winogradskyella sp. UBA3174]|tara:strand:- start:14236 stop:14841 length:606 start_codon:yes stop_codon:yes gene_type:complete